jgi:hypothetical protein
MVSWQLVLSASDRRMRKLGLTYLTYSQVVEMESWNWTSLSVKVTWWGVIYMSMNVGITKVVTLFLSWLAEYLDNVNFGIVVFIFYAIGLVGGWVGG